MIANHPTLLRCISCLVAGVLCIGVLSQAQVVDKDQTPARKEPSPLTANQKVLKLLEQPFETKIFESPAGMTLKDFIGKVSDATSRTGIGASILVDFDAFKEENPDVFKDPPDLYDIKITIPQVPKELPLGEILRIALARIPTNNAEFVVRNGIVEVTTVERADPSSLMKVLVRAVFVQRPLASAVQQLADSTGMTIIIDPCMGKADTPVTASFNSRVPLKTALTLLANMAGCEIVEMPGAVYITTGENARALRRRLRAHEPENMLQELPGFWGGGQDYKVDPYIRAAMDLQAMGEGKASSILLRAECPAVYILCRMLYTPRKQAQFRRPLIGHAFFLGGTQYAEWPLEPIELVDGVPFLITRGYGIAGMPEWPEQYAKYCITNCDWNNTRFRIRTVEDKQKALNKLLSSPKWKRKLQDDDKAILQAQIQ
jgi:hypothetical protein